MFITQNSNYYNLRKVNAIDFLFLTLCPTPFHYAKTYFGVLHNHSADVTRTDAHQVQNLYIFR